MGLLMFAQYGGNTLGPLVGGLIASIFGYRASFFIISVVYFLGGLAVIFFTREKFQPVPKEQRPSAGDVWHLATSRRMLPLLVVTTSLYISQSMVTPVIALLVKELGHGNSTATVSGAAFSLMGVVAAISSLIGGRMADRGSNLKKMMVFSCLGAGLVYLPPMFAASVPQFLTLMAFRGTFNGGLIVPASSLIGLSVSEGERGMAYGLQQSANALGSGLGPLIGGSLSSGIGLRAAFPAAAGVYALACVFVSVFLPQVSKDRQPVDSVSRMNYKR